jgi:phage N-6-adenine-methyltransferase
VGRKRIYKDDAARQAAHRADLKEKQTQHKRQGDYSTPQDLFEEYDRLYHFTLDVCATDANAKCPRYFTPEQDGLQQPWRGTCWMNPPYHQAEIPKWIRKAYEESQRGAVVVALLPARTGSAWYHEVVLPHAVVTFLRGRIKFAGMTTNPQENSMIAVFGAPCATPLAQVRCLGCDAVKACPVGEGWLCPDCAQMQWQRVEPARLEWPRWIFHHSHAARIIDTPEAMAALGDGWRYQPYS